MIGSGRVGSGSDPMLSPTLTKAYPADVNNWQSHNNQTIKIIDVTVDPLTNQYRHIKIIVSCRF